MINNYDLMTCRPSQSNISSQTLRNVQSSSSIKNKIYQSSSQSQFQLMNEAKKSIGFRIQTPQANRIPVKFYKLKEEKYQYPLTTRYEQRPSSLANMKKSQIDSKKSDSNNLLLKQLSEFKKIFLTDNKKNQQEISDDDNCIYLGQKQVSQMNQILSDLTNALKMTCDHEIKINKQNDQIQQLKTENAKLRIQMEKLQQRHIFDQDQLGQYKQNFQFHIQDFQNNEKIIKQQTNKTKQSNKYIINLENQIEMMKNTPIDNNAKANQVVQDLIRTRDQLKTQLIQKDSEIFRLQKLNQKSKVQMKIGQMQMTVGNISSKRINGQQEQQEFLDNDQLPQNFEYRYRNQNPEYSSFIQNLNNINSKQLQMHLDNQFRDQTQKQEALQAVIDSFQDNSFFNQKLNQYFHFFLQQQQCETASDLQIIINLQLSKILGTRECNLWLLQNQTGIMYTCKQNKNNLFKAIINSGAMSQIITKKQTINKINEKNVLVYENALCLQTENDQQDISKNIYKNHVVLIPVKTYYGDILGVIECIFETNQLNMDEEYILILENKILSKQLQDFQEISYIQRNIQYKDYFNKFCCDLVISKNKLDFHTKVKQWGKQLFQTNHIKFFEYSKNCLYYYDRDKRFNFFNEREVMTNINNSISGQVIKNKKYELVLDVQMNTHYDKRIDVNSILPVFFYSILDNTKEKNCVALIQMILNNKGFLNPQIQKDFESNEKQYPGDKLEQLGITFCQIIGQVFTNIQDKIF